MRLGLSEVVAVSFASSSVALKGGEELSCGSPVRKTRSQSAEELGEERYVCNEAFVHAFVGFFPMWWRGRELSADVGPRLGVENGWVMAAGVRQMSSERQ